MFTTLILKPRGPPTGPVNSHWPPQPGKNFPGSRHKRIAQNFCAVFFQNRAYTDSMTKNHVRYLAVWDLLFGFVLVRIALPSGHTRSSRARRMPLPGQLMRLFNTQTLGSSPKQSPRPDRARMADKNILSPGVTTIQFSD